MVVVDIDSHWEPARDGLDPDERVTVFAEVLAGDLYREVPRDEWPAIEQLVPPAVVEMFRNPGEDPTPSSPGAADIPGRLAWCDQIGIDFQFVNGGGLTGLEFNIEDLASSPRRAASGQRPSARRARRTLGPLLPRRDARSQRRGPRHRRDHAVPQPGKPRLQPPRRTAGRGLVHPSAVRSPLGGHGRPRNGRVPPHRQRARVLRRRLGEPRARAEGRSRPFRGSAPVERGPHAGGRDDARRVGVRRRLRPPSEPHRVRRRALGRLDPVPRLPPRPAHQRRHRHRPRCSGDGPTSSAAATCCAATSASPCCRTPTRTRRPSSASPACSRSRPTTRTARAQPHRSTTSRPCSIASTPTRAHWFMGENILEVFERMGDPLPVATAPHPA